MFGTPRIFRFLGIDVYLDWTWVLFFFIRVWPSHQRDLFDNVVFQLTVFACVLMHEFGHALACRSVGGRADRIVLWPLGGIAYVQPPDRPGAVLWSIAAGPLVNVGLIFLSLAGWVLVGGELSLGGLFSDAAGPAALIQSFLLINSMLLIFNLLPIYPLDGGQILFSLLWFVVGKPWGLILAGALGMLGAGVFGLWGIFRGDWWLILIAMFIAYRAWQGFSQGMALRKVVAIPHHPQTCCPTCGMSAPRGPFWGCSCGRTFDTIECHATCPGCGRYHQDTMCPYCRQRHPLSMWLSVEGAQRP